MDRNKSDLPTGWNKAAANHFHVRESAITSWRYAKNGTLDTIIKHNRLMDFLEGWLTDVCGMPSDIAKDKIKNIRIGY